MPHHTTTICHNAVGADNDDVKMQSWVLKKNACASLDCPTTRRRYLTTLLAPTTLMSRCNLVRSKKCLRIIGMSHHTTTICQTATGADNDGVKMQSWVFKKIACASLECPTKRQPFVTTMLVPTTMTLRCNLGCSKKSLHTIGMSHHTTTICHNAVGADNDGVKMRSWVFKKMLAHHWNVPPHDNHLSQCCWCRQRWR